MESDQGPVLSPLPPSSKRALVQSLLSGPNEQTFGKTQIKDYLERRPLSMMKRTPSLAAEGPATGKWWLLIPIQLLQFAGLLMVIPTLPTLKLVFFANDAVKAARVQSLAESSRALLTFFVSGELGRVSDAVGRVPLVVLSVICTLAPLLALLTTSNLYPYFVLFSLAGALGGQSSPAVKAYVADCCGERQRMYSFALIGACVSTVTVVGPLIGAWLDAHPGREALFQVAVGLELVAGLFAFVLPESLPTEKRRQFQVSEGLQTCAPLRVLVRSLMQGGCTSRLLWLQALRGLSSNGLITVLAFVLAQTVDFTSADFGMIMSVVGVMGIVGQAVFLPAFKHFGMREIHILTVALVVSFFQACAFMGLSIWPYKWYAYIIQPIDAMVSALAVHPMQKLGRDVVIQRSIPDMTFNLVPGTPHSHECL